MLSSRTTYFPLSTGKLKFENIKLPLLSKLILMLSIDIDQLELASGKGFVKTEG